jgi:hypothetical protein
MAIPLEVFMQLCRSLFFKKEWFGGQPLTVGQELTNAAMSLLTWFIPVFICWQIIYFGVLSVRGWSERALDAEAAAWRLKLDTQAAQLRFLKAQLNPHFLFNALNSVCGLISEDTTRAQTMVTNLSNILRHSLSSTSGTVTLEHELEVVNDYLALESIRFEERLRTTIALDPNALTTPIPPMLVQGLVENAIKHGVALLPKGGRSRSVRLSTRPC